VTQIDWFVLLAAIVAGIVIRNKYFKPGTGGTSTTATGGPAKPAAGGSGDARIISAAEFAEFMRDPAPTPQKRIAYGWSRTAPYTPYRPDAPKLFYAAVEGPETNVNPLLECARQAIHWRGAETPPDDPTAWTQTHAVLNYRKSAPGLKYDGPVRGFKAKLDSAGRTITLEAFVHYNTVAPDRAGHHAVLCLEFDDTPTQDRWRSPLSEQRVSEVVTAAAIKLDERFPTLGELLLLEGGWRYVKFDLPYYGSELRKKGAALPGAH
jgi:hypothetical protein